ncbi:hypothetical protein [Breoghania sp. JC706]|uniref:hypothetical protein n=1 Tax=Breoghania sp. JC706 TaxID=3117732 RepID=UPI003007F5E0
MGKAYFINATPTNVKIVLNGGDQHALAPISVSPTADSVTGTSWAADIKANKAPDIFGASQQASPDNELLFNSEQSGITRRYTISSTVSNVLDLYFFMFEDTIIGEDSTGSSKGISISPPVSREGSL